MKKGVVGIILSRIVGFIIFILLLAIANFLVQYIPSEIYANIINFFNTSIVLLFAMTLVGMIAEIFWIFSFPFNVPAPIISAVLSTLIITFIYKFWILLDTYIHLEIKVPLYSIYFIVFVLVLIVGYIGVFTKIPKDNEFSEELKEVRQRRKELIEEEKKKLKEGRRKMEWQEVGEQFKLALYNIGRGINNLFKDKKSANNRKRKSKL
jgi:hypothetical protein